MMIKYHCLLFRIFELKQYFYSIEVQNNCQGQGYTLATRDDGQSICYFYMDREYIRLHNPDDDGLDYEQSKKMCTDKGNKRNNKIDFKLSVFFFCFKLTKIISKSSINIIHR